MTPNRAADVQNILTCTIRNARHAIRRVEGFTFAGEMSDDDFKALAKEVEEVGELVHQLDRINRHIIPTLFEVPYGKWRGWSGLKNYRNVLAHNFQHQTKEDLFHRANKTLALREVADLLSAVTSVDMMTIPFDCGEVSAIRSLPQTLEYDDLRPGASVILLRFADNGELMASRSWRDTQDNWRVTTRWARSENEDGGFVLFHLHDTDLHLVPTPLATGKRDATSLEQNSDQYNLFVVPAEHFMWAPRLLHQRSHIHRKENKETR